MNVEVDGGWTVTAHCKESSMLFMVHGSTSTLGAIVVQW